MVLFQLNERTVHSINVLLNGIVLAIRVDVFFFNLLMDLVMLSDSIVSADDATLMPFDQANF